jgi:hypothetical protein
MFPGGLPKCFEFILGSDDFSRPFGEGERGNDRHYPGGDRIRLPGALKPVSQEVDVAI